MGGAPWGLEVYKNKVILKGGPQPITFTDKKLVLTCNSIDEAGKLDVMIYNNTGPSELRPISKALGSGAAVDSFGVQFMNDGGSRNIRNDNGGKKKGMKGKKK
uniref:Uncharacterized protein n=1 Tax=Chaetoceros debilis TaxID=122233 RepID=A0A7S3QJV3_9STRA|mmetsp:Transcript_6741/g.9926  ORF Transcript_6741/g.9926 Transcript_6741/m.9926 type:complete len:103 (-) Transcript_6741:233-541(-)